MNINFDKTVKVIFIMTMAFTIIFSGLSPSLVSAESDTNVTPGVEESLKNFDDITSEVSKQTRDTLIEATKERLKADLNGLTSEDLDFNTIKTLSLESGDYFVQYLVKEQSSYNTISGVSFVLNNEFVVNGIFEIQLKDIDEENALLEVWSDGVNTISQHLVAPDVQPQWSWKKFKNCMLNDLGMNHAAANTLAFLCGAGCMATAGVGCLACLAASASITGFSTGWCVAKAQ